MHSNCIYYTTISVVINLCKKKKINNCNANKFNILTYMFSINTLRAYIQFIRLKLYI